MIKNITKLLEKGRVANLVGGPARMRLPATFLLLIDMSGFKSYFIYESRSAEVKRERERERERERKREVGISVFKNLEVSTLTLGLKG